MRVVGKIGIQFLRYHFRDLIAAHLGWTRY